VRPAARAAARRCTTLRDAPLPAHPTCTPCRTPRTPNPVRVCGEFVAFLFVCFEQRV